MRLGVGWGVGWGDGAGGGGRGANGAGGCTWELVPDEVVV